MPTNRTPVLKSPDSEWVGALRKELSCMSIATESLTTFNIRHLRDLERDARKIAKDQGAKIRRHPQSGIDVTYSTGQKVHYHGWNQLLDDFIIGFHLAE